MSPNILQVFPSISRGIQRLMGSYVTGAGGAGANLFGLVIDNDSMHSKPWWKKLIRLYPFSQLAERRILKHLWPDLHAALPRAYYHFVFYCLYLTFINSFLTIKKYEFI